MKNFFLAKLFAFIGRKLDGHKTKIGGIGTILLGLVGIAGMIFPDQGLPPMDLETSIGCITGGFAVLGIGGKIEKQTAAVVAATPDTAELRAYVAGPAEASPVAISEGQL